MKKHVRSTSQALLPLLRMRRDVEDLDTLVFKAFRSRTYNLRPLLFLLKSTSCKESAVPARTSTSRLSDMASTNMCH